MMGYIVMNDKIVLSSNTLKPEEKECLHENDDEIGKVSDFESIEVVEIYENQFAVSINKGNYSICLWRYNMGNGNIPYLETTKAETSSEKHLIKPMGPIWDEDVYCFDDWGGKYVGVNKDLLGGFSEK
jgi:hypothetical protein